MAGSLSFLRIDGKGFFCRVDFKSGIFVESKSGKSCAISGFANLQLCVIVYLC